MAPVRGARKRKRAEKAAPAPSPGLLPPLPDGSDWWYVFFRRIAGQSSFPREHQDMESVLKMSRKTFDYICSLVKKDLTTKTYGFRNFRFGDKTILGVEDQVVVALMRLTSGESLQNIGMWFGMNHSAISNITWRFIESMEEHAICHLKWPSPEEMGTIKVKFEKIYGLPNCCGAIDTTHILMCSSAQPNSKVWLDNENKNSMVLQAVVDADMRFRDIVSGWPGSMDGSCILRTSGFYRLCEKGIRLDEQMELPGGSVVREYIVGDASYPLLPWLMTPYQGHGLQAAKAEFNKRHTAAATVVQNALATLKGRWRVIQGELWRPDKHRLPRIIFVCCLITNIIIDMEGAPIKEMLVSGNHDLGYKKQFSNVADDNAVKQRDLLSQHVAPGE
ncbi:protein ALP1-like isoform X1 [Phragmites australis]|uniref:protein ALP1-like isoform X1 n=2 Tax=Phragmites australis TaxID=29695 RepID=UPI002D76EFD9|nr:protein ALP1-like isoform X1 [Phragmites australis]